jgi:hypothetical protein
LADFRRDRWVLPIADIAFAPAVGAMATWPNLSKGGQGFRNEWRDREGPLAAKKGVLSTF